jgi:hypothetical protein
MQILGITNKKFRDLLSQAEEYHHKKQVEIEGNKIRRNHKGESVNRNYRFLSRYVCICFI